jgi:hypothetical protein
MREPLTSFNDKVNYERRHMGQLYAISGGTDHNDCRYYGADELDVVKSDALTLQLMGGEGVRVHRRTGDGPAHPTGRSSTCGQGR